MSGGIDYFKSGEVVYGLGEPEFVRWNRHFDPIFMEIICLGEPEFVGWNRLYIGYGILNGLGEPEFVGWNRHRIYRIL